MLFDHHFSCKRKVPDLSSPLLVTPLIVCLAALISPQTAHAADILPTQNELNPRHLDFGPVTVAPGATVSQVFADNLNSAENWFAELLIINPTVNVEAVNFYAKFVWPGGSEEGLISLEPGFGYLLQVEPIDIPETKPDWLFRFTNPTNLSLTVESVVSEALSVTIPPEFGEVIVDPSGNLVPPRSGNNFTPGDVVGDFVTMEIVPEPTGLIVAVIGACMALLGRRRMTT